jgi:hypothetical protein
MRACAYSIIIRMADANVWRLWPLKSNLLDDNRWEWLLPFRIDVWNSDDDEEEDKSDRRRSMVE